MLTRATLTIRLHPNDDVVIARAQLVGGTTLIDEHVTIVGLVEAMPQIKAGNVVPLAASGPSAKELLPQLAEFKDSHPDLDLSVWFGVFAPARTPKDVQMVLNAELNKALQAPDVRKRLGEFGLTPMPGSPADLDTLMRQDRARYGPLVKALGIVAE